MDGHLLRYNKKVTYALIDLETFNLCLHFCTNRPWQVGIIKTRGEDVIDAKDIRINWPDAPHLKIGKEAAFITKFDHKIHDKYAILPKDAFPKFWPILKEVDYIIMHNGLKFDIYLIKGFAEMMGEEWKWMLPKIIDTRAVAQGIKMGIPFKPQESTFLEYQFRVLNLYAKGVKTSLSALGKEFGIVHDYERLHDAVVDLELNWKVWNKLKVQIEI